MLWSHKATVALLLIAFIAGCSSPPPAPVDRRQEPPSQKIAYHVVSHGETLFSIAWRYEKELEKLAAVNNLPASYTIYPGQRLLLDTSRIPRVKPPVRKTEPVATTKRIPNSKAPTAKPPSSSAVTNSAVTKRNAPAPKQPVVNRAVSSWQWPVKGKVVKGFNAAKLFKGIDISSLPGSPVKAVAPGTVVYAGDGLRGYGQLIIVRHNSIFISAYAHNRKIFVREGSQVKSGQKIAEVGGDPANVRRFYFEIRKDGKPVNPLNYLPKQ